MPSDALHPSSGLGAGPAAAVPGQALGPHGPGGPAGSVDTLAPLAAGGGLRRRRSDATLPPTPRSARAAAPRSVLHAMPAAPGAVARAMGLPAGGDGGSQRCTGAAASAEPAPAGDAPSWAGRCAALAPELLEAGIPMTPGLAYAAADGQLFDGGRCDHLALRRRVRGGPLVPNAAVNALLAQISACPTLTAESFRVAAAAALACPLVGTVPPDPVAAANGVTYSRAALVAALGPAPQEAVAPPLRGLELVPAGAVPQANAALTALVARLGLAAPASPTAGGRDAEALGLGAGTDAETVARAPERATAAPESEAGDASETDAPPSPRAFARRTVRLTACALPELVGEVTAIDLADGLVGVGRADGSVQVLDVIAMEELASWPAHGPGAGGVARLALDEPYVLTVGARAPAAPRMWEIWGALLQRLELPGGDPVGWMGFRQGGWVDAMTTGGRFLSWRSGPFARPAPCRERALGAAGRAAGNSVRLAWLSAGEVEIWEPGHVDSVRGSAPPGTIEQLLPLDTDALVRLRDGTVAAILWDGDGGEDGQGGYTWGACPRGLEAASVGLLAARTDVWAATLDRDRVRVHLVDAPCGRVAVRLAVDVLPQGRVAVGEGARADAAVSIIDLDASVVALAVDDSHLAVVTERRTLALFEVNV